MKTKNNIQKTVLKSVAVVTGLVILSFTVNAQGFMNLNFENNGTNHIAMLMDNSENSLTKTNNVNSLTIVKAFENYLVEETEKTMPLEDWMINESSIAATFSIETETENPLEVEDWMKEESSFNSFSAMLEAETESELVLESWMFDEKIFNNKVYENKVTKNESQPVSTATFYYREVNIEKKLEVEGWMLSSNTWEK